MGKAGRGRERERSTFPKAKGVISEPIVLKAVLAEVWNDCFSFPQVSLISEAVTEDSSSNIKAITASQEEPKLQLEE